MTNLKKSLILACVVIMVLTAGVCWALFTAQGSLWTVRQALVYGMGVTDVTFGSPTGNLWSGWGVKNIQSRNLRFGSLKGSAEAGETKISLAWNKIIPQISIEADSVTLQADGIFERATIRSLRFNNSVLDFEHIAILNLKEIQGDSEIEIENGSIGFPIESDSSVQATQVSLQSSMGPITVSQVSGSATRLFLQDIEVKDSPFLPEGGYLRIQKLTVSAPFTVKNIAAIENGGLRLIGSDNVLFYGTQEKGQLDFHIYSKNADLSGVVSAFKPLKGVSASVSDAEISIKGPLNDISIQGVMDVDRLSYRRFTLTNSPALSIDLNLKMLPKDHELHGKVQAQSGELAHKNIRLNLEPGNVQFKGDPEVPSFDLKASTKIANASIRIKLAGNLVKPDLSLSSEPSYPQEKILVMLATGKEWSGTEGAIREGKVSADAAREFIDYFVLGGSGEKLAKSLGIKEVLLKADESSQGIELKKAISKKVDVGYGVEKISEESKKGAIAQKVGVDYKTSANTVVSVEGKVTSNNAKPENPSDQDSGVDKSLTLNMKRSF